MFNFPFLYLVTWLTSVAIIIWWYERSLRNLRSSTRNAKNRAEFIEEELAACRKKAYSNEPDVDTTQEAPITRNINAVFDQQLHLTSQKDDLKIVEGIGPKIEKLLHEASIFTFSDLSQTEIPHIKDILEQAGSRYSMHDPTTWPKQAEMAMEGRWDELKKWQSKLDKGRIV
jgi:predicted flap endonuclease-1-like 5' DNA nuclease